MIGWAVVEDQSLPKNPKSCEANSLAHPPSTTNKPDGLLTSLDSLQDRDSFASQNVRVDPDEEAKQDDRILRFQTACGFWVFGEYERAAASFREVLELDHDDPRFARYWLASCLFQLGSSDELDELLQQHDDNSGIWRFAQALHAFRQHGDTEDAQRMLVEADHLEPGFEHYLLQDEIVDARREVRFDADPAERAFGCARLFLPAWRGVPGAAAWARRFLKVPPIGARSGRCAAPVSAGRTAVIALAARDLASRSDAVPRRATRRRRANVVVRRGQYRPSGDPGGDRDRPATYRSGRLECVDSIFSQTD